MNIESEEILIEAVIQNYFSTTYHANEKKLRESFHPEARIAGDFNGQYCDWSLEEFVHRIASQDSAAKKGEVFDKKILLLDQIANAAVVKARVLVGGFIFVDYISLLKINDQWVIRNKIFTTLSTN